MINSVAHYLWHSTNKAAYCETVDLFSSVFYISYVYVICSSGRVSHLNFKTGPLNWLILPNFVYQNENIKLVDFCQLES